MTASKAASPRGRPRKVIQTSAPWPIKPRRRGAPPMPFGAVLGASGRQTALARSQRLIEVFEAAVASGEGYAEAVRCAAKAVGAHERTAQSAIAKHRKLVEQARHMQAMFKSAPVIYSSE